MFITQQYQKAQTLPCFWFKHWDKKKICLTLFDDLFHLIGKKIVVTSYNMPFWIIKAFNNCYFNFLFGCITFVPISSYLVMALPSEATWISLQLCVLLQMSWVVYDRQMPVWRCYRSAHPEAWAPGDLSPLISEASLQAQLPGKTTTNNFSVLVV